jgi:GAF domain-containing protein
VKNRVILVYVFLGAAFGLIFPLTSILWQLYEQQLPFSWSGLVAVHNGNLLTWIIDTAPFILGLFALFAGLRQASVIELNRELRRRYAERSQLVNQLQAVRTQLEQHVEKQIVELKTAAQVAREAAAIHDLKLLLDQAVRLISERFGFYHCGIFLTNENGSMATLQAANSEGGQRMLARGHQLAVGKIGIVGKVAATGEPRIALDVELDTTYFSNPDLPNTRSEMALPLKIRDQVIGVLDVQSEKVDAFNTEDLEIMQLMADQIALAIDNARLLQKGQQSLRETESLLNALTRMAWRERLEDRRFVYVFTPAGVKPAENPAPSLSAVDGFLLEVPIRLREQQFGLLQLRRDQDHGPWTEKEKSLVEEIVSQLSLSLENARLLERVERQAYKERMVSRISGKVQGSLELDTVMKNAAQEIGRALKASKVQIRIKPPGAITEAESSTETSLPVRS